MPALRRRNAVPPMPREGVRFWLAFWPVAGSWSFTRVAPKHRAGVLMAYDKLPGMRGTPWWKTKREAIAAARRVGCYVEPNGLVVEPHHRVKNRAPARRRNPPFMGALARPHGLKHLGNVAYDIIIEMVRRLRYYDVGDQVRIFSAPGKGASEWHRLRVEWKAPGTQHPARVGNLFDDDALRDQLAGWLDVYGMKIFWRGHWSVMISAYMD